MSGRLPHASSSAPPPEWIAQRTVILREKIAEAEDWRRRYAFWSKLFSCLTPWLPWNHPLHYAFSSKEAAFERERKGYEAELNALLVLGGAK